MSERERLVEVMRNALWRHFFARDEDAETIEYQKQAWAYDWDRTEQRAIDMLTALEAAGVRLVPAEADEALCATYRRTLRRRSTMDFDPTADDQEAYRAWVAAQGSQERDS